MAPAVAPRPQVRRPIAKIRRERRRHLAHLEPVERALRDHLRRVLHPGGPQIEPEDRVAPERAEPAMEVSDVAPEEQPPEERKPRVAEPLVQRGHGALLDAALEAVAHDEVVARAQALDERIDGLEVVREIGVAHEDVRAAGGSDAAGEGRAVTAGSDGDDAGTGA